MRVGEQELGTLMIERNLDALWAALRTRLLLAAAVALVALLIGLHQRGAPARGGGAAGARWSTSWTRWRAATPMTPPAEAGPQEIRRLYERFNDLLAQIGLREAALQRHRDELEATVDARTRDLREAKGGGRGGQPREVGVPRQHEPRDPHAHERRAGR